MEGQGAEQPPRGPIKSDAEQAAEVRALKEQYIQEQEKEKRKELWSLARKYVGTDADGREKLRQQSLTPKGKFTTADWELVEAMAKDLERKREQKKQGEKES